MSWCLMEVCNPFNVCIFSSRWIFLMRLRVEFMFSFVGTVCQLVYAVIKHTYTHIHIHIYMCVCVSSSYNRYPHTAPERSSSPSNFSPSTSSIPSPLHLPELTSSHLPLHPHSRITRLEAQHPFESGSSRTSHT